MDNILKNKTIDTMIQLLDYVRTIPVVSVVFDVVADNKSIEEFLIEDADKTDWEGKPLSDDEIRKNIYNRLQLFYKSSGFNHIGPSKLTMTQTYTIQTINFDNIYKLIGGDYENMPKGYKFVGPIRIKSFN